MIRLEIRNDGTGTVEIGHYDVRIALPGLGWVNARVTNFDRSLGWAELVAEATEALSERITRPSDSVPAA